MDKGVPILAVPKSHMPPQTADYHASGCKVALVTLLTVVTKHLTNKPGEERVNFDLNCKGAVHPSLGSMTCNKKLPSATAASRLAGTLIANTSGYLKTSA